MALRSMFATQLGARIRGPAFLKDRIQASTVSQGRERQQRTDWIANCGVETMQMRSRDDERYPDPDELGGVPDRVIGVSFWNPFKN